MGADGAEGDDAPLSDLAREVRERRRRRARDRTDGRDRDGVGVDPGGVVGENDDWDDLFESVETPAVDAVSVWETLGADDPDAPATPGTGAGDDPEAVEASAAGDGEHVVSKRAYCQRCPHFSAPPAVACDHEGTVIVEVVDADRFRVRDCPVAHGAAESDDADVR